MRKFLAVLALAVASMTSLSACYTAGRATGETTEEVERGTQDFEQGFEHGRQ